MVRKSEEEYWTSTFKRFKLTKMMVAVGLR